MKWCLNNALKDLYPLKIRPCQIDSSAFAQAGRLAPSTAKHQPLFSKVFKSTFLELDRFVDNLIKIVHQYPNHLYTWLEFFSGRNT